MQRIAMIVFVLLFLSGCAVSRPTIQIQIRSEEVQKSPEYSVTVTL
jgi:PBP1b-binding outer membrane lipoprotein LpoB